MYKKLLVAIDVSERGIKALREANALARALGAQVVGLYVLRPDTAQKRALPDAEAIKKAKVRKPLTAEDVRKKIESGAPGELAKIEFVTIVGKNTARIIVDFAGKYECDLIVMGSRSLPGASSLIMRSVTSDVLSSGEKPVLVIR